MQKLELRLPPVVLVLIVAMMMWALAFAVPSLAVTVPVAGGLAMGFIMAGAAFALLGVYEFKQASTTVDPRCPDKSASLVVSGVYRLSRNPMYLGFLLLLLGWACYLQHYLPFLLVPVFVLYINRFQIRPEERYMQQKFAADFTAYVSRVPRWVSPAAAVLAVLLVAIGYAAAAWL